MAAPDELCTRTAAFVISVGGGGAAGGEGASGGGRGGIEGGGEFGGIGGGGPTKRNPQSSQSVASEQRLNSEPLPPSSQNPSLAHPD